MYNQQLGLIALSRVTFKETDGRLMVREAPEVQEHLPQRAQRTQRKSQKEMLPLIHGAHGEPGQVPGQVNADRRHQVDERLEPSVDAGSRSTAAEQAPHLRPMSVNSTAVLPASVRGDASRFVTEERAQAGVPCHTSIVTPEFHPVEPTASASGTPGFHPTKPTPGFVGTPGLNALSPMDSGLTGEGRDRRHRRHGTTSP
jgi:hypothetical protein